MSVAIIIIGFAVIIPITHAVIGTRLKELVHGVKELVLGLAWLAWLAWLALMALLAWLALMALMALVAWLALMALYRAFEI